MDPLTRSFPGSAPPVPLGPRPRWPSGTLVPGLAARLAPRMFAGFHPEDTQQCLATAWRGPVRVHALLSPGPGLSGPALVRQFEHLACLYYLELVARGLVHWGEPVMWLQHWPARAGAPASQASDQFERVWLVPWAWPGRAGLLKRRRIPVAVALAGLPDSPASA